MKSAISIAICLTSLVAALPAADVERTLPANWQYKITALRGPGCPDFGQDDGNSRVTRLTFGQNTMDGSEIYYWFAAYPSLRVAIDGDEHSWCETELGYEEFSDYTQKTPSTDYRLRLHKNGTRVIATYDLEKGVKATFKFAYDTGDDTVRRPLPFYRSLSNTIHQITDTVTWKGPLASGKYQKEDSSPVSADNEIYKLPKCGAGKIKFRTDLFIEGKNGAKGYVRSESLVDDKGKEQFYGIQQGWSYDWEKCKK
jgi:hypothetical protein